jgi:hypothetical protein
MSKEAKPEHIPHTGKNTAYHMEWQFCREAAVWVGNRPIRPNLYPFATELRNWMLRKPDRLGVFSSEEQLFTNHYTYDASVLSSIFMYVINDGAEFIKSTVSLDPCEAEIKRIRIYGEYVLYTARLSEVFIKQLLFCTTFPEGDYRGSALGALLSKDCSGCRNSKEKRHKLSLLGSLAHRYRLCHTYDNCLNQHLALANRRRDLEAAHSGVTKFMPKSSAEVRSQFEKEFDKVGVDFIHMLYHISEIETRMLDEVSQLIERAAINACPVVQMSN